MKSEAAGDALKLEQLWRVNYAPLRSWLEKGSQVL